MSIWSRKLRYSKYLVKSFKSYDLFGYLAPRRWRCFYTLPFRCSCETLRQFLLNLINRKVVICVETFKNKYKIYIIFISHVNSLFFVTNCLSKFWEGDNPTYLICLWILERDYLDFPKSAHRIQTWKGLDHHPKWNPFHVCSCATTLMRGNHRNEHN